MNLAKKILSIALVLALLCALPISVRAQSETLAAADVSEYPVIFFGGGFHLLYHNENTEEQKTVFDSLAVTDILMSKLDDALEAVKALDFDRVVDILKEAVWDWFGPIRMDINGDSVDPDITCDGPSWEPWYDGGPYLAFDWRLDPVENAERLNRYLDYACKRYGVEKFNFSAVSGSVPFLLSYLDIYGYDRVASIVLNAATHKGATTFGELATGRVAIDMEAVAKLQQLDMLGENLAFVQPLLRWLFEPGVLSVIEKFLKLAAKRVVARLYDEIIIPLVGTMPVIWTYIPLKDYETAKKNLLKGDPQYATLVEKLDRYHDIAVRADDILLETALRVKVAIWAGYGMAMIPLGMGTATQSDLMVDTKYASLGATCAPLGIPFFPWYKQKITHGTHDHVSPDRLIDASTCLLPDQTWFVKNKPHNSESFYGGWYDWFLKTDKPSVYGNEDYPQFMECFPPENGEEFGIYLPLVVEPENVLLAVLKTIGLWLLRIWRWLLLLPLFWI